MTSPARAEMKPVIVNTARRRKPLSFFFQFRALLPLLIYCVLLIVLTLLFVWLPIRQQVAADPSPVVKALLSAQLFRIEVMLAPLLFIAGGIAAVYALLLARRIAGPVQDVREHLAKLALGDTEPLALLPGDEFREIETPLNAVGSRIGHMTRSHLEMLRLLRRNLEGISERNAQHKLSETDLKESIAVLMHDIDAEIKKLQLKA